MSTEPNILLRHLYNIGSTIQSRVEAKTAIKTGLVASLSLIIGVYFTKLFHRPDALLSGIWCVLTAIIVLQSHLGSTYQDAWNRFFGILIGSIMGGIFTSAFGSDAFSIGFGVFSTVLVCSLVGLNESYRIAAASTAVIIVLWGLRPEISPWTFSTFRFLDSTIGILVAVVVAHTVWPFHSVEKIRNNMTDVLTILKQLFNIILNLNLDKEQKENAEVILYQDFKKLIAESQEILKETKLEILTTSVNFDDWSLLFNYVERIFESIVSMRFVYDEKTREILDQSLSSHLDYVIDEINLSFIALTEMLETKQVGKYPNLAETLYHLKEELARFRATHVTKNFALQDVENFFVFFYTLKTLIEDLQKSEILMLRINLK